MTKRLDIQGIRALAVVMVVAYHAGLPLPGGFSGVDVFFVVSGFVIGRLLLKELETTGRIDLARFFIGRAKRLLPALAVVLVVTVAAAGMVVIGDRMTDTLVSAFAAMLMLANGFFFLSTGGYFDVQDGEVPLLHTWTLSVEGQFYVVAPLALLVAWWLAGRSGRPRRQVLFAVTLALAALSFVAAQALASGWPLGGRISDPQSLAFYLSPTRAWEFLVGSLLAIVEARLVASRRYGAATVAAAAGLVAIVAGAFLAGDTGPVPGTGVLLPVLGTGLLIAGTTVVPAGRLARALGWRPLTALGDRSYAWYLWHWPFIVLGGIAMPDHDVALPLALASLVPAWLSYRFVEDRVRRSRAVPGRRVAALTIASLALLAVVGVLVNAGQDVMVERAGIPNLRQAIQQSALVEGGACRADDGSTWSPGESPGAAHCLPDAPPGARRILLVGDSQADAYAAGVREVARREGMRLDAITGPSCLASRVRDERGRPAAGNTPVCAAMPDQVQATIAAEPPALLIIAQSRSNQLLQGVGTGMALKLDDRRLSEAYRAGLRELTAPVVAGGGHILFLRTVPVGSRDGSVCGTPLRILQGETRTCLSESRRRAERDPGKLVVWTATRSFVATTARTSFFDPSGLFCAATECSQLRNGKLAYRNSDHLSVDGARDLAEPLGTAIRRALGRR